MHYYHKLYKEEEELPKIKKIYIICFKNIKKKETLKLTNF